jgi:S1-C subfamily serine protease
VVKVEAVARPCPRSSALKVDGSGLVISPDHVLTNAHVVAGLEYPPSVVLADGQTYPARVVLYDRRRDLAVLYVPGLQATALHFTWSAAYGARAIVAGYPGGGRLTLAPATVGTSFRAAVSGTTRELQVFPVRGQVQPGNSGGPLMAPEGGVYGVIFAWSPATPQSGWAMTAAEVAGDAVTGSTLTRSVPTPAHLSC